MPAKKKSKPSFKVPEDLESAPQAGWVYRSETGSSAEEEKAPAATEAPVPPALPVERETPPARPAHDRDSESTHSKSKEEDDDSDSSSSGILDLTAKTFSSGMATIGNALMLGAAIFTAPIKVGMWIIGLRSRD